jgi:hypothetical protein
MLDPGKVDGRRRRFGRKPVRLRVEGVLTSRDFRDGVIEAERRRRRGGPGGFARTRIERPVVGDHLVEPLVEAADDIGEALRLVAILGLGMQVGRRALRPLGQPIETGGDVAEAVAIFGAAGAGARRIARPRGRADCRRPFDRRVDPLA